MFCEDFSSLVCLNFQVTSISWKENELNMVDTPGHADFGGEVKLKFGILSIGTVYLD